MSTTGSWTIERSDGVIVKIDKPNVSFRFGRGKELPPGQQLNDKYISRNHISFECKSSSLFAKQSGRNPTFYSAAFRQVPRAGLEFRPADANKTSAAQPDGSGNKNEENIVFVPCGNEKTNQVVISSSGNEIELCTLHFPEELGLPKLTVRYTPPRIEKVDHMPRGVPAVPLVFPKDDDDDDDDDNNNNNNSHGSTPPAWRGILDAVLQSNKGSDS
ncbi:uncharacterized protein TEOVI_000468500 [Trypanosoma equiperdum]|uniref:FHA domain-containing protein n=1 Tax=Trypanosoma equiperdum TaxID=5694 RepID=A0A1G4I5J6_TRYEQ|nr:hypothetical protein, conserved [Trypanosoma equiperdum]